MGDRYVAQKEDIRMWCEHVGAKRVYQSNVHMRTIRTRLERFEQETGLSYPGIGNWQREVKVRLCASASWRDGS